MDTVDVSPDDVVLHDADGKPIVWRGGRPTGNYIRMIGGPMDGQRHNLRGGVMIEVANPDKGKWGPYDRLAYAYETRDGEVVGVFYDPMRDSGAAED